MAIEKLTEEYLLSLLNEAPANPEANNTTMQTSNINATYEPQEQDSSMGVEDSMGGEGTMDPGMEEMDMGNGSGDSASMGGDMSMEQSPQVNAKDIFKKRKLFDDYKNLLSMIDDVMGATSTILSRNLTPDAKKVFIYINRKLEENRQKVVIILTEQYFNLSYQQLLTLYMYIKIAIKSYVDIAKQINTLQKIKK